MLYGITKILLPNEYLQLSVPTKHSRNYINLYKITCRWNICFVNRKQFYRRNSDSKNKYYISYIIIDKPNQITINSCTLWSSWYFNQSNYQYNSISLHMHVCIYLIMRNEWNLVIELFQIDIILCLICFDNVRLICRYKETKLSV